VISADAFQADPEVRRANYRRSTHNHVDVCFFCGRGLTQSALDRGSWVHMTVGGMLVPRGTEVPDDESQGCFPVGSECARRIPAEYRLRFTVPAVTTVTDDPDTF